MEIILTHNNTDFDGLAASFAASKLYPRAIPVLAGKLSANVQEFMALHKDTLGFKTIKDIPSQQVKRVILVDTKMASRVGPLGQLTQKPDVDVHIYDHHPAGADDTPASQLVREDVGAVTTILVEILRRRHCRLTPFEATVLALGIYEDTGGLMFSTTTERDAAAVAYLLGRGANLSVINEFIDRPLSKEQKELLRELTSRSVVLVIHGIRVVVTSAELNEYVEGLSHLVHRLGDIESPDVMVAVVRMHDRVHVVARSRIEAVRVNTLLQPLGGGGHGAAAAASIKGGDAALTLEQLVRSLYDTIRPQRGAREIMSSPVKTITPDTTVDDAGKVMLRYGHTGLPVVEGDRLVGVISRRDFDKAYIHGLRHAPVKGFMSRNVITITPDTSLRHIQRLLIEHDIGRLPVLEEGKLVGIVSRTDVLRTLHGENMPVRYWTNFGSARAGEAAPVGTDRQVVDRMRQQLPPHILDLFDDVGRLADGEGVQVYVVGGFVRDLLLGVNNLDIDLVVEGDGICFATELARFLKGTLRTHEKFGTAVIRWGDQKIDVATARREFYQYPAALPQVEASDLRQDLYRRDFTINALAIRLNRERFGELVDFFQGVKDLEQGLVRVLYNLSFVEDPTRILRAIRFEQRYGFTIEPQTMGFAREAIARQMIRELSYERMVDELILILSEENPAPALRRLTELGLWEYLLPGLVWTPWVEVEVSAVPSMLKALAEAGLPVPQRPWVVYFYILARHLSMEGVCFVNDHYPLKQVMRDDLFKLHKEGKDTNQALMNWLRGDDPLSRLESILRDWSEEAILALRAGFSLPDTVRLFEAWRRIRETRPCLTGNDLKALKIPPGPIYARILNRLRRERLDGRLTDAGAERDFVRRLLQEEAPASETKGGNHV
ncbi:tRNA nucleotidyltransferase/poly(a) polymerase [Heliomicrobium modesticaldum Ice1]|uniref:tRNA nucleotidyltransferase/poly(A) polymerase n=1 Tax=Heliobacterium modesticaldum (strain ATCC 51547 / Ice1) TaxID=498761 RepID=B0TFC2_HELMI|nr:CBS domain-containing protein [Heliomicrobium modesticaldum]ABZ84439.1 tRNA nucleotidyltransferase/poly(a) polymerase [Heliomicrobium modesticaldum Ice1]